MEHLHNVNINVDKGYNKILLYFGIFKTHNILPNNVLILGGEGDKNYKSLSEYM